VTRVLSPCSGRVFGLSEVSDPVFAQEFVGPGVAIEPIPERMAVVAPVSGTIVKLHPHAFAMCSEAGHGVLVHLGIDTCHLNGVGFQLLAAEGDVVEAGHEVVSWNPAEIGGDGISTTVMVVALDRPAGSVTSPLLGGVCSSRDPLFDIDE